jgi:hypothetical protein
MENINFKIKLHGHDCNDSWPACKVSINDDVMFDSEIQGETLVEFDASVEDDSVDNKLVIDYYNKDFRLDVVLDADGNIVKDKTIDILAICVEDIDLNQIPFDNNTVEVYEQAYPQELPRTRKNDMELSWNSTWTLEFSSPVYIWLLENI